MRFILLLIGCLFLTGCAGLGQVFESGTAAITDGKDGDDSTQGDAIGLKGTSYSDISDKTVRRVTLIQAVGYVCTKQSENHNNQRKLSEVDLPSPLMIVVDVTGEAKALSLPSDYQQGSVTHYSDSHGPFDMQTCMAKGLESGWERIGHALVGLGKQLVPWAGGYYIADKILDTTRAIAEKPTIQGDDNVIRDVDVIGGEGDTTVNIDEAAEGVIPAGPLEFNPVDLNTPQAESPAVALCPEGFTPVSDERGVGCSDGIGGFIPSL